MRTISLTLMPHISYNLTVSISTSFQVLQRWSGVLPVTETSPEHACGGREAAEEPVLVAFSLMDPQLSQQSFSQVLSTSSLTSAALRTPANTPCTNWISISSPVNWAGGGASWGDRQGRFYRMESRRYQMRREKIVWQLLLQVNLNL